MKPTNNDDAAVAPTRDDKFPPGVRFIVGNEGAERFSFYGMRAILYIYLTTLFLKFVPEANVSPEVALAAKAEATHTAHLFMAGVYAAPMIGAILADRLLGKYLVIFWVSLIYILGHALLAVGGRLGATGDFSSGQWIFFAGLGCIALGSGGIKPCVSANVGDQFSAKNGHLVTKVFQIFYFMINYGSFFATLAIPLLYKKWGAEVAFAVPGVLMALAALVFWMGRNRFVRMPPKPGGLLGFLDVATAVLLYVPFVAIAFFGVFNAFAAQVTGGDVTWRLFFADFFVKFWRHFAISAAALVLAWFAFSARQKRLQDTGFLALLVWSFQHRHLRMPGQGFFEPAREKFGEEAAEGPPAVLRIMLVFSMVSMFWALFDQHSSTWIEQANQMDLAFTAPTYLWYYALGATVVLSLFGGVWLMLWVSNVNIPMAITRGVLTLVGVGLAAAALLQSTKGGSTAVLLAPSQLPALNPLMVMMIIPVLALCVWAPLSRRGVEVRPLRKMTIGMFMTAGAFALAAVLQQAIEAAGPGQVHVLLQVPQYLVLTTAEVLVSITGLEFAYTQAPRAMKSTIMGFWLLCVTIGNLLVAFLAPLQAKLPLSKFFLVFTGIMVVASLVFMVLASRYKGKSYLQNVAQ